MILPENYVVYLTMGSSYKMSAIPLEQRLIQKFNLDMGLIHPGDKNYRILTNFK